MDTSLNSAIEIQDNSDVQTDSNEASAFEDKQEMVSIETEQEDSPHHKSQTEAEKLTTFIQEIQKLAKTSNSNSFAENFARLLSQEHPVSHQTFCFLSAIEFLLRKKAHHKFIITLLAFLRRYEETMFLHLKHMILRLHYTSPQNYVSPNAKTMEYLFLSQQKTTMPEYLISEAIWIHAEAADTEQAINFFQSIAETDIKYKGNTGSRKKLASSIIDYLRNKTLASNLKIKDHTKKAVSRLTALLFNNLNYLWNRRLQAKHTEHKASLSSSISAEDLVFLSNNFTKGLEYFHLSKEYVFRNNRFEKQILSLKIVAICVALLLLSLSGLAIGTIISTTSIALITLSVISFFAIRYWLLTNKPTNPLTDLQKYNKLVSEQFPNLTLNQVNDLLNKQLLSISDPKKIALLPAYTKQIIASLPTPFKHIHKEDIATVYKELQNKAKKQKILNL